MIFGLSSHRAEHWWFFDGGRAFASDVANPANEDFYGPAQPKTSQPDKAYLDNWLARTCELVAKYSPQIVWFDWWIEEPAFAPYLKKFASYYYNWAKQQGTSVAINYKNQAYPPDAAVYDVERGQLKSIRPILWQTDTAVSKNSWGYIADHDYKPVTSIIHDLVDIVSKNGVLLLNIGPKPDGTIPEPEQEMLREMGRWLAINGEAIYGTRPWKRFGEGPTEIVEGTFMDVKRAAFTAQDIRFTAREDIIYAIVLGQPADGKAKITSLAEGVAVAPEKIAAIELLGTGAALKWSRDREALTVELPEGLPFAQALALRITPKAA